MPKKGKDGRKEIGLKKETTGSNIRGKSTETGRARDEGRRKGKSALKGSVGKDGSGRRQADFRERKKRTERRKKQMMKAGWECGRGTTGSYGPNFTFS